VICLSFDSDYMLQEDMQRFIQEFPLPGQVSFFLHRKYAVDFQGYEVAPHPFLTETGDWLGTVQRLAHELGIPTPVGVRTHACVSSQMLWPELAKQGYKYSSMVMLLYETGIKPFKHPWGLWELPIYYMDNSDICMRLNWPGSDHRPFHSDVIRKAVAEPGLYVFDFHPIHVILNTQTYHDYLGVREAVRSGKTSAFELAFAGYGTRAFFLDLCKEMERCGLKSSSCIEALHTYMRSGSL
jgi:hypothetical protein